jgi:hypothetical protein
VCTYNITNPNKLWERKISHMFISIKDKLYSKYFKRLDDVGTMISNYDPKREKL